MVNSSYAWLIPIFIAIIGAISTYLNILRRTSGRIATTEASQLWEEAADLRHVYQHELTRLRDEQLRLEGEISQLEKHNRDLRAEVAALQRKVDEAERQVRKLQFRIEELENHASV